MLAPVYTLHGIYILDHCRAEPPGDPEPACLRRSDPSAISKRQLRLPQPSVSKHLRVLREAGFVESRVDAQRRLYRIKPEPLMEIDAWLAPFRRFWSSHVDALERHLDRMNPPPRRNSKGKKPKR